MKNLADSLPALVGQLPQAVKDLLPHAELDVAASLAANAAANAANAASQAATAASQAASQAGLPVAQPPAGANAERRGRYERTLRELLPRVRQLPQAHTPESASASARLVVPAWVPRSRGGVAGDAGASAWGRSASSHMATGDSVLGREK